MAKRIYTEEEARERKNARQREYAKRTNYAANNRYIKEKTKRYVIQVFFSTESDIFNRLEQEENKAGYIKRLIREDIQRNSNN